jgi:uncharacterized membrane protein
MVSEPMPSDRTPARPKSGRRWLTILLFVSLVANVFLLGLFGGRLFHRHDWFDRQTEYAQQMGPIAGRALERLVRPLDAADREVVIDTVRGHADELQKIYQSVHDQRELVAQLLRADKFDRKAVDDAFAELRRRTDTMQQTLQAAVADAVAKLSPAARRQLDE